MSHRTQYRNAVKKKKHNDISLPCLITCPPDIQDDQLHHTLTKLEERDSAQKLSHRQRRIDHVYLLDFCRYIFRQGVLVECHRDLLHSSRLQLLRYILIDSSALAEKQCSVHAKYSISACVLGIIALASPLQGLALSLASLLALSRCLP